MSASSGPAGERQWRTEVDDVGRVIVFKRGRQRMPNGDEYAGEFVEGKRHGRGTFLRANGDKYVGEFKVGVYDGFGTLTLAEHRVAGRVVVGWKYQGHWKLGRKHGKGMLMDGEGDLYEGEFAEDLFNGYGVMRARNGDVYEGFWLRGRKHGTGTLRQRSGAVFQGAFYKNLFHGQGSLNYGRGLGTYVGGFRMGRRHGVGRRVWGGGAEYEGEFADDFLSGKGVYKSMRGDVYVGEFLADRFHGRGTLQFANGDRYTGQFQRGVPCGVGRHEYAAGGYYEGEFWALARTGIKWRPDHKDEQDDADPTGETGLRWQHGSKKLTDRSRKLELLKEKERRRAEAYDVRNPLSKEDRLRRVALKKKYGRMIVGSEGDNPALSPGGVVVPVADGKRHGRGVRVWASGARYEGDWFQDEIHGFGVYIGAGAEGERFEGQFVHGRREGRGVASYGNTTGGKYVCPFGRLQDGSARSIYDGEWRHDRFHGQGKFVWGDGRSYTGEFRDGKKHGFGIEVFLSRKERDAEFARRGPAGLVHRLMRYEGDYRENVREGRGRLLMASGDVFEGHLIAGRLHGHVTITFAASKRVSHAEFDFGKRVRWIDGEELAKMLAAEATLATLDGEHLSTELIRRRLKQNVEAARAAAGPVATADTPFNLRRLYVAVGDGDGDGDGEDGGRDDDDGASGGGSGRGGAARSASSRSTRSAGRSAVSAGEGGRGSGSGARAERDRAAGAAAAGGGGRGGAMPAVEELAADEDSENSDEEGRRPRTRRIQDA